MHLRKHVEIVRATGAEETGRSRETFFGRALCLPGVTSRSVRATRLRCDTPLSEGCIQGAERTSSDVKLCPRPPRLCDRSGSQTHRVRRPRARLKDRGPWLYGCCHGTFGGLEVADILAKSSKDQVIVVVRKRYAGIWYASVRGSGVPLLGMADRSAQSQRLTELVAAHRSCCSTNSNEAAATVIIRSSAIWVHGAAREQHVHVVNGGDAQQGLGKLSR